MASDDLNTTLAPRGGARGQGQPSAARPENSGADRGQQLVPRAGARGAFSDAMQRSRSGENRLRVDPQAAGAARRVLSMLNSDDADLDESQLVPAAAVVHHAERREREGRRDCLVDILRSELQAATAFIEHRERWWNEGLQNAKSYVGMELERVRANEQNAEQAMNAQMTTLVETLRAAQGRAELSSLAAIDQQRITNDLEQYANMLNAQGRAMINNSEQKHWSIVSELAQARSEFARVETEAERKIRMTLVACETQTEGL